LPSPGASAAADERRLGQPHERDQKEIKATEREEHVVHAERGRRLRDEPVDILKRVDAADI
jgi:hypothetical protein